MEHGADALERHHHTDGESDGSQGLGLHTDDDKVLSNLLVRGPNTLFEIAVAPPFPADLYSPRRDSA
jgi:hypothetical protein